MRFITICGYVTPLPAEPELFKAVPGWCHHGRGGGLRAQLGPASTPGGTRNLAPALVKPMLGSSPAPGGAGRLGAPDAGSRRPLPGENLQLPVRHNSVDARDSAPICGASVRYASFRRRVTREDWGMGPEAAAMADVAAAEVLMDTGHETANHTRCKTRMQTIITPVFDTIYCSVALKNYDSFACIPDMAP